MPVTISEQPAAPIIAVQPTNSAAAYRRTLAPFTLVISGFRGNGEC